MREQLVLGHEEPPGSAPGSWILCDREQAAGYLERGVVRGICIDRGELDEALADALWLRRQQNAAPVIAVLSPSELARGCELLAAGVQELVVRGDAAAATLERRLSLIERERKAAGERSPLPGAAAARVVARSAPMQRVLELVRKVQRCEATVLIQGETGSGKEVLARLIHEGGARRGGPFVPINCAAFPETLLESELFGYVKGAFTGADRCARGLIAASDRGTLLLDEIGETTLAFQVKLLRVLQESVVRPLGSEREVRVNARIIAATNRDLRADVEAGRFRRDLFYRLSVFPIDVPPLRERPEDVVPLAEAFLARSGPSAQARVAPDAAPLLEAYAWPGNVRELENEIARALAHAPGHTELTARMLSPWIQHREAPRGWSRSGQTLRALMDEHERSVLLRALNEAGGVRVAAARTLGITRECLYKKLRRHGLQ